MSASVFVPSTAQPLKVEADSFKAPTHSQTMAIDPETDDDDSSLRTVDGLIRRRARLHPNAHVISYPSSGIDFVDYTMEQLDVFAWRVAKHYEPHLPVRRSSAEKPAVVALLGPSNLEYVVTKLALIKLGHTALLLSTRIPQVAIESLMSTTSGSTILADARYMELAGQVHESMPSIQLLEIAKREVFEFPVEVRGDTRLDTKLDREIETQNIAFIIHSSGSTGLPKPIYQTHKSCLANYAITMEMKAFITLPLFHNHGICNYFRAIWDLKPIHLYNADLPLTQDYLVQIFRQHKFEIFYGVPYALKLMSESEEGIKLLREPRIVMYGGSACPDDLGNTLVDNGVNLVGHYGATEVGQLMTSFRPREDKAWNYVRESDKLHPFLKWVPQGPNLFECTVMEGWPSKVQSNRDDGSYATKDLFQPHPTIPRAWKYIARLDDTLVLMNGEKFNPVAMEGSIRSNKNVAEAVVFGAGRPYLGVLVVPAPSLAGKPSDEILNAVWPVIEAANKSADAFGRISKSMVRLLPTDCAYPRTDKGSIIRQAFYRTYKDEIDQTYDAQDVGSGDLQALELPELRDFIHKLLAEALTTQTQVEDDTDFFLLGLDSLQAIQMRSEILKTIDLGGNKLGQNMVFENPSVEKLANFLIGLRLGEDTSTTAIEAQMQDLIGKYANIRPSRASTAVVTGTTGSLGAHVLAKLCDNPDINTVYCLVRASDKSQALARVKDSLLQRRVYHTMPLASRRKITALPSDLSDAKLGLSVHDYQNVARDLRSVIHCAWSVNFNMHLSSFEKSNMAGVNHLLALCKSSPTLASMNFCSSVSTCSRATQSPVPESLPDLEWAQGMGYAQSKSVAEHVCAKAAEQGITSRVLRVGQIAGDTKHGVWNAQEAVPMMMQTAVTIGALPVLQETPSWLPVDTVAEAIADISLSESDSGFANVTHPKTFSWNEDLLPALRSAGLEFEEVEPKAWVQRLRSSNPDPKINPPIKLVDFFASKYDKDEFPPSKVFATEVACSLSPALAKAPVLESSFVKKFVGYFTTNAWKPVERNPATKTAVFMAGPSGTGKTTIGTETSNWLGVPFVEGDALHTRAAVEKMRSDQALSDEDRAGWLGRVCDHARETVTDLDHSSAIISCSALKASYRAQIREHLSKNGINAVFVDLQASREVLVQRMKARKGHYMGAQMVDGQLEAYEGAYDQELDVLPVDAEAEQHEVVEEVKWLLTKAVGLSS